jgi:hypothetical protein
VGDQRDVAQLQRIHDRCDRVSGLRQARRQVHAFTEPAPGSIQGDTAKVVLEACRTSRHTAPGAHVDEQQRRALTDVGDRDLAVSCSSAYVGHGHAEVESHAGRSMTGSVCIATPFN